MADIVYTTVNLPAAFVGVPYEASIGYKSAATVFTAQSIVAGTVLNGLPAGLAMDTVSNPGSLRISGTPTGAASGGNTPKSGVGTYTFTVSGTDTAGAVVSGTLSIQLCQSPQDLTMIGQHGTQNGLN
jgi:hypothetical protein